MFLGAHDSSLFESTSERVVDGVSMKLCVALRGERERSFRFVSRRACTRSVAAQSRSVLNGEQSSLTSQAVVRPASPSAARHSGACEAAHWLHSRKRDVPAAFEAL